MNAVTDVLDGTVAADDQRLAKVRIHTLSLGVDADELELLPAAIHDVLDAEVELAAHDDGLRLAGELVQEVDRDAIDLVVHIETLDVLAVVLHDDVDEVVDGGVFVADEDFAVEDFVVAKDVEEHFFVEVLWW